MDEAAADRGEKRGERRRKESHSTSRTYCSSQTNTRCDASLPNVDPTLGNRSVRQTGTIDWTMRGKTAVVLFSPKGERERPG